MKKITFYSIGCPRCKKIESQLYEICNSKNYQLEKIGFWESFIYGLVRLKPMPVITLDGIEIDLSDLVDSY